MKSLLSKIWHQRWVFRSLPFTIYFNFHYLPFQQAIRLPIWLYKPKFGKLGGHIEVKTPRVKSGMIRMGFHNVGLYPNNGIFISNEGNITFHGTAMIGNDCYIGIGKTGSIDFGDNFRATTTFRLTSFNKVFFGANVRFGWDCLVTDTDFHKLRKKDGSFTKGHAPISLGSNVWIANGCRLLKGTEIPNYCTLSAGTIVSGKVNCPEYSIIGQKKELSVLATGLWLDPTDEQIIYE